jgi:hypothetical protein
MGAAIAAPEGSGGESVGYGAMYHGGGAAIGDGGVGGGGNPQGEG